ncbi:MAG: [protein-PII] uridylyltransferase, partial [Verrucomicrobiota bacterium]
PKSVEHFDGFYVIGDLLFPESRDIFNQDPQRLIRLFQHAQIRKLSLSPDLQQLIRRRLRLVDRTFQYSRAARETFAAILSRKGEVGRIMRMMHQVDFLGRYIPEFGELTCLVQHEFFHRYTADEHTLVCIEKLDSLIDTKDPKFADYRVLFQKLENPYVLYLSLLLHDTGKAANAKHHAEASALYAQRVAARHQLSSDQRKTLIFLVDNHMVLSSTVQRRNLEDSATIEEFAGIVTNQIRLDALMLLTLADGQGTSQESWSDWKESLIWQLYRHTSQLLADSGEYFRQHRIEREELRAAVAKKMARDYSEEIDAHFLSMPDTYFHVSKPNDIIGHIRLFREFLEKRAFDSELALAPAVKWVAHPERGHSELWICTWDRTQLLAKIAGALALAQMNILSADIYTRGDNLVLDLFRVCDTKFQAVTDAKDMVQVEKLLNQALLQEDFYFLTLLQKAKRKPAFHLSQELDFPTRIAIDNDAHPVYTLVDIQTPDRLGLLYHLLRGFAEIDVNIALSRIATEKGAAIDSFYITDTMGRKIRSAASIVALQKALQRAAESAT